VCCDFRPRRSWSRPFLHLHGLVPLSTCHRKTNHGDRLSNSAISDDLEMTPGAPWVVPHRRGRFEYASPDLDPAIWSPPGVDTVALRRSIPVVFADIRKAFETVDRQMLLHPGKVAGYPLDLLYMSLQAYSWCRFVVSGGYSSRGVFPKRGIAAGATGATYELGSSTCWEWFAASGQSSCPSESRCMLTT
jgi:hypothetical protein